MSINIAHDIENYADFVDIPEVEKKKTPVAEPSCVLNKLKRKVLFREQVTV